MTNDIPTSIEAWIKDNVSARLSALSMLLALIVKEHPDRDAILERYKALMAAVESPPEATSAAADHLVGLISVFVQKDV